MTGVQTCALPIFKQANIPVEMHIYNSGGHGFGMKQTGKTSANWPLQFEDWLKERGFIRQ